MEQPTVPKKPQVPGAWDVRAKPGDPDPLAGRRRRDQRPSARPWTRPCRCTPTTSVSAVFCRTSSARSAPRNDTAPTVRAVGDLERVQLGRAPDDDRVAVPRNQLRHRARRPSASRSSRAARRAEARRRPRRASRRRSRNRSRETGPPIAGCSTSYTRSYWVPVSSRSPTSHAGQRLGYTQSMPPSATDGDASSSGQTSRSCGSGCDGSAVSRVNTSVPVFQKNRSPKSRPGSAWWPDIAPEIAAAATDRGQHHRQAEAAHAAKLRDPPSSCSLTSS